MPKVQKPQEFSQFRPISLCNFVNKIFSKILARRLAPLLPKIISPNQSGFVQERSISDNYLLVQEVIAGIKRKARGGNVVFKLDMTKAYDRMKWPFLIQVLRAFGFGERWINMIWRIISNVWFSIVINGSLCGFFKSARGLRQGDPLSPALFIIRAEVLSRSLNQLVSCRGFQGFSIPQGCPSITHLGYADDVLIFSSATASTLRLVMRVLEEYEASSGQLINKTKSCFLVHAKIGRPRRKSIQQVTGFKPMSFAIWYLGYPLYSGRKKKEYFAGLCLAVVSKVDSWKNRLLSAGGRIVLLKRVLSTLLVHLLMAVSPPKSIFKEIEGRWKDLCVPGEEGGMGFRRLEDIHDAFSIKLWWNFQSLSSLWATFMKAKYCAQVHPNLVHRGRGSQVWRRMMEVRQLAESHIGWIGRSGSSNFWFDNSLGTDSLSSRLDNVLDHRWVPHGVVKEVVRVAPPVGHLPDLMIVAPGVAVENFLLLITTIAWAVTCGLLPVEVQGSWAVQVWVLPITGYREHRACVRYGRYGVTCLALLRGSSWHILVWFIVSCPSGSLVVWEEGNSIRYEGIQVRFDRLCTLVMADLVELFSIYFKQQRSFPAAWVHFYAAISRWVPRMSYSIVRWLRPPSGVLKLNIDGCSKGNPGVSGGGGVIRDSGGKLLLAFACHLGQATSVQAEVRALLFGVKVCIQWGFRKLEAELDSLVLVHILFGKARCPWSVFLEVQQLLGFMEHIPSVGHCFRQANQVADVLSKVGCTLGERSFTRLHQSYRRRLEVPCA
nr:uncharacterized protein LOC113729105 [Coffea arabica]